MLTSRILAAALRRIARTANDLALRLELPQLTAEELHDRLRGRPRETEPEDPLMPESLRRAGALP